MCVCVLCYLMTYSYPNFFYPFRGNSKPKKAQPTPDPLCFPPLGNIKEKQEQTDRMDEMDREFIGCGLGRWESHVMNCAHPTPGPGKAYD